MSIAAKIAISVLGGGTCAVVGCYAGGVFSEGVGTGSSYNLTKNNDSKYLAGTVGNEYGMYLVETTEPNNKTGGRNAYKEYKKDWQSSKVHINVSYDYRSNGDDKKSLNGFCHDLYQEYTGAGQNVNFDGDDDLVNDPLSNSSLQEYQKAGFVLKYCSPLETRPTTITKKGSEYGENVIGSDEKIEKLKLVETKGDANETFGKLQQQGFETLNKSKLDNYFKKFFKEGNNKSIKEICETAYEAEASNSEETEDKPKLENVIKYCSFIRPNTAHI